MRVRHPGAAALVQILAASLAAGGTRFTYVSPLPGSTHIPVRSSIAVRTGEAFAGFLPAGAVSVTAAGSRSGLAAGSLVLSDDNRTVIFYPSKPFRQLETVSVCITARPASRQGGECDTLRFSFTTGGTPHPPAARRPFRDERGAGFPAFPSPGGPRATTGVDSLPSDFPTISVTASNHPPPLSIYLANFPFDTRIPYTPYLMRINEEGAPTFLRRMSHDCYDFREQPGGRMTYNDGAFGYFMAMDSTFTVVDSFKCGNGYDTDLHELRLLPDGHALLLGDDTQIVPMDTVVAGGDTEAIVYGIILQELDRAKNVIFQWRSWDHYRITDAIGVDLTHHTVDYCHSNAIEIDADGNLILSSRHLCEITKIDRTTGDIIWRWGGKNNQFTFVNDSAAFSYQHAIRRLPNGHWTMFDNGNFHVPQYSRAVEYALDEEQKTATVVWQYRHAPDIFGMAMGFVERMDDGNTLIGWGATNPSVTLTDPAGTTLLELSLPPGQFSYRAFASGGTPTSAAPRPHDLPGSPALEQNYPNPFNPSTVITYRLPAAADIRLTVHDILGRETALLADRRESAGTHTVTWNASNSASGVYFCRLRAGGYVRIMKMTLVK